MAINAIWTFQSPYSRNKKVHLFSLKLSSVGIAVTDPTMCFLEDCGSTLRVRKVIECSELGKLLCGSLLDTPESIANEEGLACEAQRNILKLHQGHLVM